MDAGDEFGDLYTDVLLPSSSPSPKKKQEDPQTLIPDDDSILGPSPLAPDDSSSPTSTRDEAPVAESRGNDEDWDSDSEDDLRIVLNDDDDGLGGAKDEQKEEGEEDDDELVIVAEDAELLLPRHRGAEEGEGEWGEDGEAEEKEGDEAAKGAAAAAAATTTRGGFGHGFHPQHPSPFKYVRPGATPIQAGPTAGQGRAIQRGFHSGYVLPPYGPGRPFGIGLEFTLPPHKTIFDFDIDAFEEKPWRYPGVDVTDFFNFGMEEDSWKDYCKKLAQFRLEVTMQSKIRVYEGGHAEQDFDPNFPPELAAAGGIQDASAENSQLGKMDAGPTNLSGQGIGTVQRRILPTGRPIQVEVGYGERLPTVDTRIPRIRDVDVVIEIVLQDFGDESSRSIVSSEKPEREGLVDDHKEACEGEDVDKKGDSTCNGHVSQLQNGMRNIIRPCSPAMDYERSMSRSPSHADELSRPADCGRGMMEVPISELKGAIPIQNVSEKEKLQDTIIGEERHREGSPAVSGKITRELTLEPRDEEQDNGKADGEDLASDLHVSGDTCYENDSSYSDKKQKLDSYVEQKAVPNSIEAGDQRTIDNENSREKSGSGKGYLRLGEAVEDEVTQGAICRRSGGSRRHYTDGGHTGRQKDDFEQRSRQGINRSHVSLKGREDLFHSHPQKDVNATAVRHAKNTEDYVRLKDEGAFVTGGRHKKDDDIHSLTQSGKECRRKHDEEIESRHKRRVGERKGREGTDSSGWRSQHDKDGMLRQEEREDILASPEIVNDYYRRRKEDGHGKRAGIKEVLHAYDRELGSNETADHRSKGDVARARGRTGSYDSVRHKDVILNQREWEDICAQRDRGRGISLKTSRVLEDKSYHGKDNCKGLVSGTVFKDGRRHEQLRRGDRLEEDARSQHKGRHKKHTSETRASRQEKHYRHGRTHSHSGRTSSTIDNQNIYREKNRENSKKSKDGMADRNGLVLTKRKQMDHTFNQVEKVLQISPDSSFKGATDTQADNLSPAVSSNEECLPPDGKIAKCVDVYRKCKDGTAPNDENQQDSRSGRSKSERWTCHKERDFSSTSIQSVRSPVGCGDRDFNVDTVPHAELGQSGRNKGNDMDCRDHCVAQLEEEHRHLETFEKLKKRSERFNLPMHGEKEPMTTKKVESDVPLTCCEVPTDPEIKLKRPPRKRRWVGS